MIEEYVPEILAQRPHVGAALRINPFQFTSKESHSSAGSGVNPEDVALLLPERQSIVDLSAPAASSLQEPPTVNVVPSSPSPPWARSPDNPEYIEVAAEKRKVSDEEMRQTKRASDASQSSVYDSDALSSPLRSESTPPESPEESLKTTDEQVPAPSVPQIEQMQDDVFTTEVPSEITTETLPIQPAPPSSYFSSFLPQAPATSSIISYVSSWWATPTTATVTTTTTTTDTTMLESVLNRAECTESERQMITDVLARAQAHGVAYTPRHVQSQQIPEVRAADLVQAPVEPVENLPSWSGSSGGGTEEGVVMKPRDIFGSQSIPSTVQPTPSAHSLHSPFPDEEPVPQFDARRPSKEPANEALPEETHSVGSEPREPSVTSSALEQWANEPAKPEKQPDAHFMELTDIFRRTQHTPEPPPDPVIHVRDSDGRRRDVRMPRWVSDPEAESRTPTPPRAAPVAALDDLNIIEMTGMHPLELGDASKPFVRLVAARPPRGVVTTTSAAERGSSPHDLLHQLEVVEESASRHSRRESGVVATASEEIIRQHHKAAHATVELPMPKWSERKETALSRTPSNEELVMSRVDEVVRERLQNKMHDILRMRRVVTAFESAQRGSATANAARHLAEARAPKSTAVTELHASLIHPLITRAQEGHAAVATPLQAQLLLVRQLTASDTLSTTSSTERQAMQLSQQVHTCSWALSRCSPPTYKWTAALIDRVRC